MGKLDELRRAVGGNIDDSMGVGRPPRRDEGGAAGPGARAPARWHGVIKSKDAAEVPVDRIGPDPDQPREDFDEGALRRLADSLRGRGQLQPIRVRWDEGRGRYIIVCGERRWRAAHLAGLTTMTCIIMEGPIAPADLLALQLIENCAREDLKPIEQARAYRALMDRNGWTVSRVARELAIDHSNVSRALALLDLPTVVRERVEQGTLAPATAYEISKVEGPAAQAELAGRVLAEGLSRREAVAEVRRAAGGPTARAEGPGAAGGRAPTSRVFRTPPAGTKVTVENERGLDDPTALAAVEEVARRLRDEMGAPDPAAARSGSPAGGRPG